MKDKDGKELFPGFLNKVKTVFMPPGYFPGVKTHWFFFWKHNEDPAEGIPDVEENFEIYNPALTQPMKVYLLLNSIMLVYCTFLFNQVLYSYKISLIKTFQSRITMPWLNFLLAVGFFLVRMQMFGYYMDHRWFASIYDVTSMLFCIQVASWLSLGNLALYCKFCIGGALLLVWYGFTPKQLKKV